MKEINCSAGGVGAARAEGILAGRKTVTSVPVLSATALIVVALLLGLAIVQPRVAREAMTVAGSPASGTGIDMARHYAPSCDAAVAVRSSTDSELANWYLVQAGDQPASLAIRCMGR